METPGRTVQKFAFLVLSACVGLVGVCFMFYEECSVQSPPPPLSSRINPNTASLGELLTLPGIGPARAEAIVSYRESQPRTPAFTSLEDLYQVHGLGPALVRDMASWLCLDETPVK
jgi:competence ComEA-like helix-hairpin-helix protein